MLSLLGLKDVILNELNKRIRESGLPLGLTTSGNEIVVVLSRDEIVKMLISQFPEMVKPYISIDANDIRIRIKLG